MATNKFVVKNGLQTQDIDFVSPNRLNTISIDMLDTDTLSVSGNSGQLFSITDSLTGTIFAVNDISGVPSIEVFDTGKIQLAETFGNVLIGTATDNGTDKLQIYGSLLATTVKGNLDWSYIQNKPDPVVTVTLTGDVTGTANATLTDLGNGTITIATTVTADSVALGTDTTGNYVATIAGTANQINVSGSGSETAAVTLSLPQDIATTSGPTFGSLNIRGTSPTIYLKDTDARSSMIHQNDGYFYILRGNGTDSSVWDQYDGYWPLRINLENNTATFGGQITKRGVNVPALHIADTAPSAYNDGDLWWESDTGKLKIKYNDGTSTQWVDAVPIPDTSNFYSKAGGAISGPVVVNSSITATGKIFADQGVTGNASTATKLETARNINGVAFDGSANITITTNTPNNHIIKFDTGNTEGTDLYTFNGSVAKTLDIKAGTNVTLTKAEGTITINANDSSVDWSEIQNKPDPVVTVTLTGDVTGTANATLTDVGNGTISIATTVAADSVALGTDTTGNYVASVATTSPLSGGATGSEGTAITLSLADGYGDTKNPYASKTAKTFLAAPDAADGVPTFRAIVASDIPVLNQSTTGNATTATTWQTARTLTIGSTSKSVDGSSNVAWTLAEIGAAAASHTHSYLPLSGGTMTGVISMSGTQTVTHAGFAGIEYYNNSTWQVYIGTEDNASGARYNSRSGSHTWYNNATQTMQLSGNNLNVAGSVTAASHKTTNWTILQNASGDLEFNYA